MRGNESGLLPHASPFAGSPLCLDDPAELHVIVHFANTPKHISPYDLHLTEKPSKPSTTAAAGLSLPLPFILIVPTSATQPREPEALPPLFKLHTDGLLEHPLARPVERLNLVDAVPDAIEELVEAFFADDLSDS